MKRAIEIQGHRGARARRPENTLPSFEAALDAGVHSIETDIRLTQDGDWVVVHDAELNPATCFVSFNGRINPFRRPHRVDRLAVLSVQRIIAEGNPDPTRFRNQAAEKTPLTEAFAVEKFVKPHHPYQIPSLKDLFAFIHYYEAETATDRRVILDLEIKCEPFSTAVWLMRLEGLARRIAESGMANRCRVRSFDHRLVKQFKEVMPEVETAVLIAETLPIDPVRITMDAGASIYCPDYRFLAAEQIEDLHRAGIRVIPWTVNAPVDQQQLIEWGVDGITTDDPAALIEVVNDLSAKTTSCPSPSPELPSLP